MAIAQSGKRLVCWIAVALLVVLLSCSRQAESRDLDYHRGRNALSMGRFDWARFYFAADLEKNPTRPESLRGLGIGWISGYQGSASKAIDAFNDYLELNPDDFEIHLRLARAWFVVGERSRALSALEDLDPSLEVQILTAKILLEEDPRSALALAMAILDTTADDFESRVLAARAYTRLGEDEAAFVEASRAVDIDPLSAELWYLIAQNRRRLGSLEESEQALVTLELLRQLPGPGSSLAPRQELALLLQIEDRLGARSLSFKRRLGRLLLEVGHLEDATQLIEKIIADPGCDSTCLLVLAQTAHTQARTLLARDLYQSVLDRDPAHLKALAQKAQLAYESQDFDTALRLSGQGLELDPHYAPLHFTSGLLALSRGDSEDAVRFLVTAVELVPWLARYRRTLADLYLTRGDREAFDRLLEETPAPDPEIDAYRERHAL